MKHLIVFLMSELLIGVAGKMQAARLDTAELTGACASTPAAALLAARSGVEPVAAVSGYRVDALHWDPLLKQNWAIIQSCDHPERPLRMLETDLVAPHLAMRFARAATRSYAVLPIVRVGDVVRLWRQDRFAHIEMLGTSEENGAVGSRVRIRLPASHEPDGETAGPQYLAGVVRGPADVEMER